MAVKDGKIVGHVLFTPVTIETADGTIPALALAPLAVHPQFQNQGIGSKLVEHGLKICNKSNYGIVIVIGLPGYYKRFGFTSARENELEVEFEVPDEAFYAKEIISGALEGVRGIVCIPEIFFKYM